MIGPSVGSEKEGRMEGIGDQEIQGGRRRGFIGVTRGKERC